MSDLPLRTEAPATPPRNPERLQQRRATEPTLARCGHLSLEIDDVINHWEAASPPASPVPVPVPLAPPTPLTNPNQGLRAALGLPALRQRHPNERKHPEHGFGWETTKIMCRRIHNPSSVLPPPPALPSGQAVSMAALPSAHFAPATAAQPQQPRQCADCGSHCCHYGALMARSSAVTPGYTDLLIEAGRARTRREMQELRVRKPMGVEEFETFLRCEVCKRGFCPGCVGLCAERLCGEPVCKGCALVDAKCGVCSMF